MWYSTIFTEKLEYFLAPRYLISPPNAWSGSATSRGSTVCTYCYTANVIQFQIRGFPLFESYDQGGINQFSRSPEVMDTKKRKFQHFRHENVNLIMAHFHFLSCIKHRFSTLNKTLQMYKIIFTCVLVTFTAAPQTQPLNAIRVGKRRVLCNPKFDYNFLGHVTSISSGPNYFWLPDVHCSSLSQQDRICAGKHT